MKNTTIVFMRSWLGLLAASICGSAFWGCSSGENSSGDDGVGASAGSPISGGSSSGAASQGGSGAQAGSAASGGSPSGLVGSFSVVLNPAIDATGPFTSVFGTVYDDVYPTDVIETVVAEDDVCKVYKFSRHTCTSPSCTTTQACTASDVCTDKPSLVSVGDVTLDGVGDASVKLSAINNNYQNAGELAYPGFAEGDDITLTATGEHYPAFTITAPGVAPIELSESTYSLSSGTPLTLQWTPEAAGTANLEIVLNISKHGGSAGYLECEVEDSGELTIGAELITALIDLGVAGFPQLAVRRSNRAETQLDAAVIALEVATLAAPTLEIEGYCSCFNSSDCGSCGDTTKTACDSVKKLCVVP